MVEKAQMKVSFIQSVEEVHTVERCPHKADVVGSNPAFSNVPIVSVVSTGDCGSPGSGSSPDRHLELRNESWIV